MEATLILVACAREQNELESLDTSCFQTRAYCFCACTKSLYSICAVSDVLPAISAQARGADAWSQRLGASLARPWVMRTGVLRAFVTETL